MGSSFPRLLRQYSWQIAGVVLNLALNISLAKGWADRLPNSAVLTLYIASLLPIAYWVFTHEKLLMQRERLKTIFREHPLSIIVISGTLLFVLVTTGATITAKLSKRFSKPNSPVANAQPSKPQQSQVPTEQTQKPALPNPKTPTKKRGPARVSQSPEPERTQPSPNTYQSCPNGICIGGNNIGSPTVNNFGIVERHLSEMDRTTLVSGLSGITIPVYFGAMMASPDAYKYAEELRDAFRAAGVPKKFNSDIIEMMTFAGGSSWAGVEIGWKGHANVGQQITVAKDSEIGRITTALLNAHVNVNAFHQDQNIEDNAVLVVVSFAK